MSATKCLVAMSLCALLAGCDADDEGDEGTGGELGGGTKTANAVQACNDTVDRLADTFIRTCDGADEDDRPAVEEQLESGFPGGSCAGADQVRDKDALYDVCFPGLEELTACPMEGTDLPEACREQIVFVQ